MEENKETQGALSRRVFIEEEKQFQILLKKISTNILFHQYFAKLFSKTNISSYRIFTADRKRYPFWLNQTLFVEQKST